MTGLTSPTNMPVMQAQCATCLFRPEIEQNDPAALTGVRSRVLTIGSLHCHSTGWPNGTHLCRGARDWQLQVFHRLGFLEVPTDEAATCGKEPTDEVTVGGKVPTDEAAAGVKGPTSDVTVGWKVPIDEATYGGKVPTGRVAVNWSTQWLNGARWFVGVHWSVGVR